MKFLQISGVGRSITVLCFQLTSLILFAQNHEVGVTIHLRGVFESKISLLGLTGSGTFKPVKEVQAIRIGEATRLILPLEKLPGEFVLRFDYKEKESSTPYPSEKYLFIYNQDLELWANPKNVNNPDSTWFQKEERENAAFANFSMENAKRKEKLGLLQNFLMNYDDPGSEFYRQGMKEYEQRRQSYNLWLTSMTTQDKGLFVSSLYHFQHIPETSLDGSESDRILSLASHYFDGFDFQDSFAIRTSYMNKWMDGYVNLYGQLSKTVALRDSLFPLAGKTAIEKARKGNPKVYGWMVDYFYRGYEANGLDVGTKILKPYIDDPNCL
ncbi:MAG: alkyl hydroperoxide reductase, partial [Bacteroidota bacterium]